MVAAACNILDGFSREKGHLNRGEAWGRNRLDVVRPSQLTVPTATIRKGSIKLVLGFH